MAIEKLDRARITLLVVDIQERLCAAMPQERLGEVLARTAALIEGARVLSIPTRVTEQYSKGLGPTVALLRERLTAASAKPPIEKVEFSAAVPALTSQLGAQRQVLIAGMETHICVYQTVRDLVGLGHLPVLCADAVLSRSPRDYEVGLQLCRDAGAMVTSVESALFDLLGRAGTPEFKAISAAVK
jgi:nicotinamidase-related amidase